MPYTLLVGLQVCDDARYDAYRAGMGPLLERYGGGFSYDFRISQTVVSATSAPINRVFAIYFRDEAAQEAFFADEAYLKVKEAHFEGAVAATTILGRLR